MIVSASPKMKPVMTDFVRKSEMKPRRTIPAPIRIRPTMSASAVLSAMNVAGSPPARSPTTEADMIAIVELTVTLR
jgi:hypothetical protein